MSGDADGAAGDAESDAIAEASAAESETEAAVDRKVDRTAGQPAATELLGAALLALVPIATLVLPCVALLKLVGPSWSGTGTLVVAVIAATVVGLGGSYALGPVLVQRSLENLLDGNSNEAIETRIAERAAARGLDAPAVRFVDVDAATIAVVDSVTETTVVVPSRITELDADTRNAVVDHALARIDTSNAALTTALLAPALFVEAWTLVGLELARRREETEENERRPRMLGAGDREERGVPWVVPAVGGVLLLVAVAPLWVVFATGDRLLVGGGRTRVDDLAAIDGDAGSLADALTFARDGRGDRDWPPTLDRLSRLGMADPVTQRVRGTSRIELRVRLARLRARENRTGTASN